jgi:hypothetical protein
MTAQPRVISSLGHKRQATSDKRSFSSVIGLCSYETGDGMHKDMAQAVEWFRKAAAQQGEAHVTAQAQAHHIA